MSKLQQKIDYKSDGDLNADGVFGCAKKLFDFEVLLHPAEVKLNLPAALVKRGDASALASRSFVTSRSSLPVSIVTRTSRTGSQSGFFRLLACLAGR